MMLGITHSSLCRLTQVIGVKKSGVADTLNVYKNARKDGADWSGLKPQLRPSFPYWMRRRKFHGVFQNERSDTLDDQACTDPSRTK